MTKKSNFVPDFGAFDPNLGLYFFEDFTSTCSPTLFQATIICNLNEN